MKIHSLPLILQCSLLIPLLSVAEEYTLRQSTTHNKYERIFWADPVLEAMISYIAEDKTEVRLTYIENGGNESGRKPDSQGGTAFFSIYYNPKSTEGGKAIKPDGTATLTRTPETGLTHELGHIFGWMNPYSFVTKLFHPNLAFNKHTEFRGEVVACIAENIYREATGQPLRISYSYNEKDIQSTDHSNSELRYSVLDKILMGILTIK